MAPLFPQPATARVLRSDFHFELPPELIAQAPLAERSASRMLVVPPAPAPLADSGVRELPQFLRAGDTMALSIAGLGEQRQTDHAWDAAVLDA